MHKHDCRKIHDLRDLSITAKETSEPNAMDEMNTHRYNLAYAIVQLGYKSTDTIERGKYIYERAILECLKIMRNDPFFIGACESTVLLLAYIGYDRLCQSLIKFMLDPPTFSASDGRFYFPDGEEADVQERIRQYTKIVSDLDDDAWIYGPLTDNATRFALSDYDKFRDIIPTCWGANVFLVPLMLIAMRQCTDPTITPSSRKSLMQHSIELSKQVEQSAVKIFLPLPVLRALFPDSRQKWESQEAWALFSKTSKSYGLGDMAQLVDDAVENDQTRWDESCLIYWHLLKDCYALTPGILDVLEETIDEMRRLGINVVAEHPEIVTSLAEQIGNGI